MLLISYRAQNISKVCIRFEYILMLWPVSQCPMRSVIFYSYGNVAYLVKSFIS